ncbi:hypothetical protein ACLOJK_003844, partial [Asimina triloba]
MAAKWPTIQAAVQATTAAIFPIKHIQMEHPMSSKSVSSNLPFNEMTARSIFKPNRGSISIN